MFNNQVICKVAALLLGAAVLVPVTAYGSASASNSGVLEQVKQAGKIVFVTEDIYALSSHHGFKASESTGYDAEVIKAVAKEVGIKAEFVGGNFDSPFVGVDAKKCDTVADQTSAIDRRKAKYDFFEPYTYSYGAAITPKESPRNVTSFDDVKGFHIAETGTSNQNKATQGKGATIVQVNDSGQQVGTVTSGCTGVSLNDDLVVLGYLKRKPGTDTKVAAKSEKAPAAYLPFRGGSSNSVEEVSKAIVKLQKDGILTKISERHFGEDFSQE